MTSATQPLPDAGMAEHASFSARIGSRLAGEDWAAIRESLQGHGNAILRNMLTPAECTQIAEMYPDSKAFRSRVVMASHGFGRGEYKYFAYPLPNIIGGLRESLFPHLSKIANDWNGLLKQEGSYPARHADYVAQCHEAGQTRPTPLLLQYGADDFNALHQDLYGDMYFPIQAAVLLAQPGRDFDGGEFVMSDSGAEGAQLEVVPLEQGDAVLFAVRERPVPGKRGWRRAATRHGVSRVRSGHRHTVGIIFHDAR